MVSDGMGLIDDLIRLRIGVTLMSKVGSWHWQIKESDETDVVLKPSKVQKWSQEFFFRLSPNDSSTVVIASVVPTQQKVAHGKSVKYKTVYFGQDDESKKFGMVKTSSSHAIRLKVLNLNTTTDQQELAFQVYEVQLLKMTGILS